MRYITSSSNPNSHHIRESLSMLNFPIRFGQFGPGLCFPVLPQCSSTVSGISFNLWAVLHYEFSFRADTSVMLCDVWHPRLITYDWHALMHRNNFILNGNINIKKPFLAYVLIAIKPIIKVRVTLLIGYNIGTYFYK